MLKQYLQQIYLDYLNNYLTITQFASDNNISYGHAVQLINIGKHYYKKDFN